jgi:archaellin
MFSALRQRTITRLSSTIGAVSRTSWLSGRQRGAAGMEMGIMIIAPVVIAATVATTALRAGTLASQNLQSATADAVAQVGTGIESNDLVLARTDGTRITHLLVDITTTPGSAPVSLDPLASADSTTVLYIDAQQLDRDVPYSLTWISGNSDGILDPGELAELDIDVSRVASGEPFTIEIRPARGAFVSLRVQPPGGAGLPPLLRLH